jgi:UMF1 family MFS transporter
LKDAVQRRREIFGFMMFDFANSSYTTVIITSVFNAYFVQAVVNQANRGELLWSVSLSISYFLVMMLGPVLGAIADHGGLRKRFLFATYLLCVIFTCMLFFVRPGYVVTAMVFVVLSNLGYSMGENFVSSFLPDIAEEERMGRISGFAWAFGYIGGLLSLVLCLLVLTSLSEVADHTLPIRLTNLVTALFFAAAAIPTFLFLRERGVRQSLSGARGSLRIGFRRLRDTTRRIGGFGELVKLLLSLLMFNSGIAVIIAFASIFAQKELGFTPAQAVLLIIVVNVTGSVGGFGFGLVVDAIGKKNTLLITLIIWVLTVISAFFIKGKIHFWIIANFAGIAMGSSQSVARALIGVFTPRSRKAEFFSFWGFAGNFSKIIGLLTFGVISSRFMSNRLAILSTVFFFFAGMVILLFVDEKKGRRAALEYVDE